MVGEVRGVGMLAVVEAVQDKAEKRLFEPAGKVGQAVAAACLERGMIARAMPTMPHGDILDFAPPLTPIAAVAKAPIEAVANSLRQAAPLCEP